MGVQESYLRSGALRTDLPLKGRGKFNRSHPYSLRRLGIGHVATAVAANTHIGLLGVCNEAFQHA